MSLSIPTTSRPDSPKWMAASEPISPLAPVITATPTCMPPRFGRRPRIVDVPARAARCRPQGTVPVAALHSRRFVLGVLRWPQYRPIEGTGRPERLVSSRQTWVIVSTGSRCGPLPPLRPAWRRQRHAFLDAIELTVWSSTARPSGAPRPRTELRSRVYARIGSIALMEAPRRPLHGRLLTTRNRSLGGSLVATGATQVLLTVSGVLIARTLGPEDRGYLALLVVVSGICVLVGSAGLPTAVTYYVAQNRGHAAGIVRALALPAVIQVGGTAVVQLGVLFALIAHDPQRVKVAALVSLLLVPGILSHSYGITILQGQERFRPFNILRVLPTALYVGAVVAAVVLGVANLVVLMTAWAGALFLAGVIALGVALRGLPSVGDVADGPSRSQLVRFGAKSLVGSVSPIDALRLDQALVGLLLNPVTLGLYVVAQAFTNLPRAVASSVGLIAYPRVASQRRVADARRALWRYFFLGLGLSALVIGGLEIVDWEARRALLWSRVPVRYAHRASPAARHTFHGRAPRAHGRRQRYGKARPWNDW